MLPENSFVFLYGTLLSIPSFFFPCLRAAGWLNTSYSNNITRHQLSNAEARESPSSSPIFANHQSRHRDFDKGSQESLSSMPEPVDPTTITKTFKTGRKASAQANLASRSKTPKSRRRRSKGQGKNSEGIKSGMLHPAERPIEYFMQEAPFKSCWIQFHCIVSLSSGAFFCISLPKCQIIDMRNIISMCLFICWWLPQVMRATVLEALQTLSRRGQTRATRRSTIRVF